jgi:hypothetical protein
MSGKLNKLKMKFKKELEKRNNLKQEMLNNMNEDNIIENKDNIIESLNVGKNIKNDNMKNYNNIVNNDNIVITITFGDMAENHVGMQKLGELVKVGDGYSIDELLKIKKKLDEDGFVCDWYDLNKDNLYENAGVLVLRGGINNLLKKSDYNIKDLWVEQLNIDVDKKAFMKGRVVNKKARWNVCYDDFDQEPNYENKCGRVISYENVPIIGFVKNNLQNYFGEKSRDLKGEVNYYYDVKKCGIGFHGDSERRKVIAIRLGCDMPLFYQWYKNGERVGEKIKIDLSNGDMYIMSEKAVGTDWMKKKSFTLRHATGCQKYVE